MRSRDAISRLRAFILENTLFDSDSHLVLAVSGGRDSMAMLALLHAMGYRITVAHVNFQLRGVESDADAEFVKAYCDRHGIALRSNAVNCADHASTNGLSVQESARQLRYDWFDEVLKQSEASHICTGHHKDDHAETLLINLLRGTGLKGLTGIPVKRANIVRPMLCFARTEIDGFISTEEIPYREDLSNADNKYLRNSIRNRLMPLIEEIKPGSSKVLLSNIDRFTRQLENLKLLHDTHAVANLECTEEGILKIPLGLLLDFPYPSQELHDLVGHLGFNLTQCEDLMTPGAESGSTAYTAKHQMLRDRSYILIRSILETKSTDVIEIKIGSSTQCAGGILNLKMKDGGIEFSSNPFVEQISADALKGQLSVRGWQPGDRIQPLGMLGQKKVSDILIDRKVSQFDKDQVHVLLCDKRIIWVIGICLSEVARVAPETENIVEALWTPQP